jgi:hypothetical protein
MTKGDGDVAVKRVAIQRLVVSSVQTTKGGRLLIVNHTITPGDNLV